MTQHVSGTILPIFRSARLYITAYGFQHLRCWQESWDAGRQAVCTVHCAEDVIRKTSSTQCTRPASRLPKTPNRTLSTENHMQLYTALRS